MTIIVFTKRFKPMQSLFFTRISLTFLFLFFCSCVGFSKNQFVLNCEGCNLPAPANLIFTEIGTTSISLQWDPVPNAWGYEIQVFEADDDSLLSTSISHSTQITITGLTPGTTYWFSVAAICKSQLLPTVSQYRTSSPEVITLILDLQASFSQDLSTKMPIEEICNTSGTTVLRCTFDRYGGNNVYGEIYLEQKYSRFGLNLDNLPETYFKLGEVPSSNYSEFALDNVKYLTSDGYEFGDHIPYVKFMRNGECVFQIEVFNISASIKEVTLTFVNDGINNYGFRVFRNSGYAPEITLERVIKNLDINAVPLKSKIISKGHPVDIFSIKYIHLQLFNLNGSLLLEQNLPSTQDYHELLTPNLPPGFYFLRLDTDGVIETQKLIKTE